MIRLKFALLLRDFLFKNIQTFHTEYVTMEIAAEV